MLFHKIYLRSTRVKVLNDMTQHTTILHIKIIKLNCNLSWKEVFRDFSNHLNPILKRTFFINPGFYSSIKRRIRIQIWFLFVNRSEFLETKRAFHALPYIKRENLKYSYSMKGWMVEFQKVCLSMLVCFLVFYMKKDCKCKDFWSNKW